VDEVFGSGFAVRSGDSNDRILEAVAMERSNTIEGVDSLFNNDERDLPITDCALILRVSKIRNNQSRSPLFDGFFKEGMSIKDIATNGNKDVALF